MEPQLKGRIHYSVATGMGIIPLPTLDLFVGVELAPPLQDSGTRFSAIRLFHNEIPYVVRLSHRWQLCISQPRTIEATKRIGHLFQLDTDSDTVNATECHVAT